MLCNYCTLHISREIVRLQGGTVNLMAYGCLGNGCEYHVREAFDSYVAGELKKMRSSPPPTEKHAKMQP